MALDEKRHKFATKKYDNDFLTDNMAVNKITSKEQYHILEDYMTKNRPMALSTLRSEEAKVKWLHLVNLLNAHGPPKRDITGWKKVWSDCKQNVKKKVRNIDTDQYVRLNERELRLCNLLQLDTNSSEGQSTTNMSNETQQWIKQENFDEGLYDEHNVSAEHLSEEYGDNLSNDVINNDDSDQYDEDTVMEEMDRLSDSDDNLSVGNNNFESMTNTQTEDEIFSIYIESELEKVKDKALFVLLKQKITNLVYDAQIKMMEKGNTTKNVQKSK